MLVSNAVPIIPLFFYKGVMYYDTNKIQGLYPNLLDDHPLEYLRKIKAN
jgi:oligopeptide transport system substrate-binding protein